MRWLILLIGCQFTLAQDTIIDSFSDSDFVQNPQWIGDTSAFIINSDLKLQLNADPYSSPQKLYLHSNIIDSAFWSFYAKMAFNPSSQNYLEVVLANSDSNFWEETSLNLTLGKFQDKLSVSIISNGQSILLSESLNSVFTESTSEFWCKIHQEYGEWMIEYSLDSILWEFLPPFQLESFPTSSFGLICHYSSTRRDKFFFDDLYITGHRFRDTIPPRLTYIQLTDSLTLFLEFSEPILASSIQLNHNVYLTHSIDSFSDFEIMDAKRLQLFFSDFQYNSNYTLYLNSLTDVYQNSIVDTFWTFSKQELFPYNLEITELMIDPSPPVYLPETEYLEIHNTCLYPIQLNQVQIQIGEKYSTLPPYILPADSIVVIYPHSANSIIDSTENILILNSNFTLPNPSGFIQLLDSNQQSIYALDYKDTWYKNSHKEDGGWSLEAQYPYPCLQDINWKASSHLNGGSPRQHKYELMDSLELKSLQPYVFAYSNSTLDIIFPFSVLDSLFTNRNYYNTLFPIDSIQRLSAFSLRLYFTDNLLKNTIYTLEISNQLQPCFPIDWKTLYFGLPEKPLPNQLKLSEICFNTNSEHSEFIEFKNTSAQLLDPYDLALNIEKDSSQYTLLCSNQHGLIAGYQFLVFTESIDKLKTNYTLNPEALYIELKDWITLDDKAGEVHLLDRSLTLLNKGCYHYSWHTTLLEALENISLENVNLNQDACLSETWASALEEVNYATPGYPNSQPTAEFENTDHIKSFSPNNDGFEDLWIYIAQLPSSESVLDIYIYDLNGYLRRTLTNGILASESYQIVWDGKDDRNTTLPIGTYIITIRNRTNQSLDKKVVSITD